MTADLYAALGVARDADRAAVRRAYRRASKHAHPDVPGGSGKRFALVKLAHDTLTDDARRRHYDETGEIDEKAPDNTHSEALQCIATAFESVLAECVAARREPEQVDLVVNMRRWIRDQVAEGAKQVVHIQKVIAKNETLGARFAGGVMPQIISGRISGMRDKISAISRSCVSGENALVLLEEVTFNADPAPPAAPEIGFYRLLTQMQHGAP